MRDCPVHVLRQALLWVRSGPVKQSSGLASPLILCFKCVARGAQEPGSSTENEHLMYLPEGKSSVPLACVSAPVGPHHFPVGTIGARIVWGESEK